MAFSLKISPEAEKDLYKALDYYVDINIKLGVELYNIIFQNFEFIRDKPCSFTMKFKNIRTFPIKKYPYIICYFIDENNNSVNVIAIFNTNMKPKKWENRV